MLKTSSAIVPQCSKKPAQLDLDVALINISALRRKVITSQPTGKADLPRSLTL